MFNAVLIKIFMCGCIIFGSSILNSECAVLVDERPLHDRVIHESPLSERYNHIDEDGDHNPDYDHDAFLGEQAEEFEKLSPQERKIRLAIIVDKIDKDKDGFVTEAEMKDWIQYTQHKYVNDDVDRQWTQHNDEGLDSISWEAYRQSVYGFSGQPDQDPNDVESYRKMEERDNRRWKIADDNHDGSLTKDEFRKFLHPEEVYSMRDVVVEETLEDMDKNGDGKISLEEYIGDMYDENDGAEQDPEWVKVEREQFSDFRDSNKDGFMDKDEVANWIVPSDYDHSESEAKHLLSEADANVDGKLSKDEILDKYDLFVGSQATDFGDALIRHDEF